MGTARGIVLMEARLIREFLCSFSFATPGARKRKLKQVMPELTLKATESRPRSQTQR